MEKRIKEEEAGALIFSTQSVFGIKLNTDGYGFFYEHGKFKTLKKTNIWWLETNEKKSRNQYKITPDPIAQNTTLYLGSKYALGKINNFYQCKLGFGRQLLIGGKGTRNGIAISAIYGGGGTLGLKKPYYVQALDSLQKDLIDISYNDYPNDFVSKDKIYGASGFTYGLDKIIFVPGLHARGALRFDYGRYRESISALEVGLNIDYYARKIDLMAFSDKRQLFLNAYLAINFGKRN